MIGLSRVGLLGFAYVCVAQGDHACIMQQFLEPANCRHICRLNDNDRLKKSEDFP